MDNICGNCEFYLYEYDEDEFICKNEDSGECGITTEYDGTCDYFTEREE
jgi:hypothetical protein